MVGNSFMFLFCGEDMALYVSFCLLFFIITHITNAKICSRYMTCPMNQGGETCLIHSYCFVGHCFIVLYLSDVIHHVGCQDAYM